MEPDFSVLIPARGACPFLVQTLESISTSSISPKEVILVDDGIYSTTIKEIERFHSRLNLVVLVNSGQGLVDGLNTGLHYSTSRYIARLDADDLISPDRFKLQIDTMTANPEIVVLGGQATYIDSKGEVTGYSNYRNGRLDNKSEFKTSCMIAHPAAMIRRSVALEVGGYRSICTDGRIDLAEDFDLWLRISLLGQVHNLSDSILFYRQHGDQISTLYTPGQVFATNYVSLVHLASQINPQFQVCKLKIERFKSHFLIDSFRSLSPYISLKGRIKLLLEGVLFFIGLPIGLPSRIIKKIIRSLG